MVQLIESIIQSIVFGTLKQRQELLEQNQTQIERIGQLEEDHERFKRESSEQQDEKFLQLQAQFNVLKCEKRLSSEVDIEHAKNMLLSYHTSEDEAVRKNSLRVLYKALDFSEEEQTQFNES